MDLTIICSNAQINTYSSSRIEVTLDRCENADSIINEFDLSDVVTVFGAEALIEHIGESFCKEHFGWDEKTYDD